MIPWVGGWSLTNLDDFLEQLTAPPQALSRPSRLERDLPVEGMYRLALNEGNRKRPVFEIHKWWARRPGVNFRMIVLSALSPSSSREATLWREFYSHHNLSRLVVLDPFMGGGTSIVESVKLGARVIGVDVDPIAWFVTKKEIDPCDLTMLRHEGRAVLRDVSERIRRYYSTKCPKGHAAESIYFFWVDVGHCPRCGTEFDAHPHYVLARDARLGRKTVVCELCGEVSVIPSAVTEHRCDSCGQISHPDSGHIRLGKLSCVSCGYTFGVPGLPAGMKPLPKRLFAVEYDCSVCASSGFKKADADDLKVYSDAHEEFDRLRKRLSYPRAIIPVRGRSDPRPTNYGYRRYSDLFNARQLLGLSILQDRISSVSDRNTREFLLLAFSDTLANNNVFCYYAFDYRKLTPIFGLHAYRPVTRSVEVNLLKTGRGRGSFPRCLEKVIRGKRYCYHPSESVVQRNGRAKTVFTGERIVTSVSSEYEEWADRLTRCLLMNKSSEDLSEIPDKSVDLVLTDPPYYDNIPYAEYSDFFYVWLRDHIHPLGRAWNAQHVPSIESLYVNPRAKDQYLEQQRFFNGLTNVFKECRRVLRPGGLMAFTYHHISSDAWATLCKSVSDAGWYAVGVVPVRSEGKSGFHSYERSLKWDAVTVCRPSLGGSRTDGSAQPGKVLRWARTRLRRWSSRIRSLGMSEADRDSFLMALVSARLSQTGASVNEIDVAFQRLRIAQARRERRIRRSAKTGDE